MQDSLISLYKPTCQLVVFSDGRNYYLEHYEILEVDGKQVLSEGKPLQKKTLKKLLDSVMATDKSMFATVNQLLPANIIYYDPRPGKLKLIWHNPAQPRLLHGIYKNPVKVIVPPVLYVLEDDSLSIFVLKGNKRPELKTQLFHAPFPNIYENCTVCMGDVKKPTKTVEVQTLINAWETAFWNSEFTDHLWNEEQGKLFKQSIRNKVMFPSKLLKSTKKTVKQIINGKTSQ